MLYTAATPELAALEVRVHLDLPPELIPDDYVLMSVDLDGLEVEVLGDLPPDPAHFGDRWLQQARTPVLRVPSVIVPESANLLVNPRHPAGPGRVHAIRSFRFDPRLWLPSVNHRVNSRMAASSPSSVSGYMRFSMICCTIPIDWV